MPFVIPNATDTTSGNKYASLDQAEPDALDFEVLGNHASGVLTGCEVTPQPSYKVKVASGIVVIQNVAYVLSETTNLDLPSSPVNKRFDLVVARKSGASVSAVVVYGPDSEFNPTFPPSTSRLTAITLPTNRYIDPSTDVVLAVVLRQGAAGITEAQIVDKRVSIRSDIPLQGSSAPASSLGSDGSLYYRTGTLSPTDSSGVYYKRNGQWDEFAKAPIDPGVPIGTVIMWPATTTPNSAVWFECDGSTVSRTTYANLFSVLSTTYGSGDGSTTFTLPDFRGHYLSGLPQSGGSLGTRYGAIGNSVTLSESQLPTHSHPLSSSKTDSAYAGHRHFMNHEHPSGSTLGESQPHGHPFTGTTSQTVSETVQNLSTIVGNSPGYETSNRISGVQSPNNNVAHQHTFSGTTGNNSSGHTHPVTVPAFSGQTDTAGGHAHGLTGSTSTTGSGQAVDITPSTFHVRFFIRYA